MPTIWINAGELSGDMQGAALLQALQALHPGLQSCGMGVPISPGPDSAICCASRSFPSWA